MPFIKDRDIELWDDFDDVPTQNVGMMNRKLDILDRMDFEINQERIAMRKKKENKSMMSEAEASKVKRRLQLALKMKDQQVSEYFNHLMLFNADPFLRGKHNAYKRMLHDRKSKSI